TAREQEDGAVGAPDEKQHGDGEEQDRQAADKFRAIGKAFDEGLQTGLEGFWIHPRVLPGEFMHHWVYGSAGLLWVDPALEFGEGDDAHAGKRDLRHGYVEVRRAAERKAFGHDTDDGDGLSLLTKYSGAEGQFSAKDGSVSAELLQPESV